LVLNLQLVFSAAIAFLKLSTLQLAVLCETSCKSGQGNGAIAARWQAKAGVEPPFAGWFRPFSQEQILLRKTACIRFGKAGAHPQLALGIAIAPETLCSHCNLLILMAIAILCDSLLDFCLRFSIRFYLLRKCGLLAHTSPAFLKNCWIKKLLFACGLQFPPR
jgi:hypothetical protein